MSRLISFGPTGQVVSDATWDTVTYTSVDKSGNVIETRPVTPAEAAQATIDAANGNGAQLQAAAAGALATDRTYLAIATPTNAQVAAQVRALTQQNVALIRLATNLLDGTS